MAEKRTGGCLCGGVRYEVVGDPIVSGACYCRDCQYVSGGEAALGEVYPEPAVTVVLGEMATFSSVALSGNTVFRELCPVCGVHLLSHNSAAPQLRSIKVGTLDDPTAFSNQGSLFVASAQPWHNPEPDLPQHQTMPCLADFDRE